MGIETSTPQTSPRPAAAEGRSGKASGPARSGGGAPQGFLTALSAADAAGAEGLGDAKEAASDPSAAAAGMVPGATEVAVPWLPPSPPPVVDPQAMPMPSAELADRAGPSAEVPVTVDAFCAAGARTSAQRAVGSAAPAASDGPSWLQAPQPLAQGEAPAFGKALEVKPAKGPSGAGGEGLAAGAADAMKAHDAKFLAALEAMKSVQLARDPAAASAEMPAAWLHATGALEGERHSKRETAPEAGYAPPLASVGGGSGPSGAAPGDATVVAGAGQVAEQVALWIATDIHKAELKLEGLGTDAVEVSIRMSGNEAQVAFRTDEAQARGVLEGAASHLKDLLAREGLVLAGVSVGTSGSGDAAGSHDRQPRQEGRHRTLVAVPVVDAQVHRPVASGAGRTLDLFV